MCHIFYCITLSIDLLQRLITYIFAFIITIIVFFLLLASLLAGMAYGYKYYVAEYHNINSTFQAIRHLTLLPQGNLSEFDPKYYKGLRSYYKFMSTSTTTTNATTINDTTTKSPQALRKIKLEDDADKYDHHVVADRPTVPQIDAETVPGIEDYVKKLNWVASNNRNIQPGKQEPFKRGKAKQTASLSKRRDDKPKLRYLKKLNKSNNMKFHKDPNRYSEYSGFPVRAFPMKLTESSSDEPEIASRPQDLVVMRRTAEIYNATTISNIQAPVVVTTTTKKSIALDILEKKLMTLHNVTTTTEQMNATTLDSTKPPKEYMQILNWLLSQKNSLKSSTGKEKLIIV